MQVKVKAYKRKGRMVTNHNRNGSMRESVAAYDAGRVAPSPVSNIALNPRETPPNEGLVRKKSKDKEFNAKAKDRIAKLKKLKMGRA